MKYSDIVDESDPLVDLAKKKLDQASIQKKQQQLKVNQAKERKLRNDIQNKQSPKPKLVIGSIAVSI